MLDLYWVLDDAQQRLLLRLSPEPSGGDRATWGLALAAVESVESALQEPDQAHQIPPHIVEAIRYRHTVLRDPGFSDRGDYAQHQMFGRGRVIQVAVDDMAREHLLLLQLSPDDALGWHMGDHGALQYWIRPADLAAQRFENTVLTFESH
jgi:uncharacterized protein DUF1963